MSLADEIAAEAPAMRRYALKLTRDGDRADDLVQDTMVRALSAQQQFRPGTNLRGWLMTITHNLWATMGRRARYEPREGGDAFAAQLAAPDDPELRVLTMEIVGVVRGLSQGGGREVMALAALGAEYEEIAAQLAIPLGTVRSRLFRARERLRAL